MIVCSGPCHAKSNYMNATKKLAIATYKYNDLDDRAKEIERRHVPKKVREQAAVLGALVKLVTDKQLSFRWEF